MIGNLAANRWLSTEKKGVLFVDMLSVPTTPDFLDRVLLLVPSLTQEWEVLCKLCRCIHNSNSISAYMITLVVL